MIRWFKRVLVRSREYDDDELAWSERRADSSDDAARRASGDGSDLRELRGTVDALRSVGPVKAPRSFALTEENLSAAGYSEEEVRRVLRPGMRRVPIWQRPVLRQLPLAMTALALLVGGYFILDDIDVLGPVQLPESAQTSGGTGVQVTVEAQVAPVRTTTVAAETQFQVTVQAEVVVAAASGLTETPVATPQAAPTAEVGITVEVMREVQHEAVQVETVAASESVHEVTVEVERAVDTTVTRMLEREVSVPTPVTVVTRVAQTETLDSESPVMTMTDDRLATATSATSGMVATAQPAPTSVKDSGAGDELVGIPEPSVTTESLVVPETAIPTVSSETQVPRPSDAVSSRVWPSAVALALALAGLVVWFELRRRRKMWE